jgi:predicted transposase/invertase (TIGR01784 family)
MLTKFLDPKNDLAFKRIFGTVKNKDILIHFLNDIFARTTNPIEDVTFLKTDQNPEIAALRVSSVDILCQDLEGNKFIVEMQVAHEPGFAKRAQYYAAKTYIQQREKGTDYQDLKEVTFLAILDYALFPSKEDYLSHHHMLDTQTYERTLKDFSFSFLELSKFNKTKEHLVTMTEKWAYFFKEAPQTKEEDLDLIIGSDLIIKRAYEELNRYAWSPEALRTYDSIDMKQSADKAIHEGAFLRGLEEGIEKGIEKVAKNMLSKGNTPETIASVTGLSMQKIKNLLSAMNEGT